MLVKGLSSYSCSQNSKSINKISTAVATSPSTITNNTNYAPLFYRPLAFTGSGRVLTEVVSKIKAKSSMPIELLTTFNHPKADGSGMEKLLAFNTYDVSKKHPKIGVHVFNENQELVGQIIASVDKSAVNAEEAVLNPFVKKGEKYLYIETVDNFANASGDRPISWDFPICKDIAKTKYKGIGTKLYELLSGHVAKLGIDDNKGYACLARIESGSTDFHSKLGFNSYGYTLERESNGWIEPQFEGMYMPEATFNNLKKKGLELLNHSDS